MGLFDARTHEALLVLHGHKGGITQVGGWMVGLGADGVRRSAFLWASMGQVYWVRVWACVHVCKEMVGCLFSPAYFGCSQLCALQAMLLYAKAVVWESKRRLYQ